MPDKQQPAPELQSRSVQRRVALQKGETVPRFEPAPIVTVTHGAPPGCTADAIAQSGKWQTFEQPATPSLSANVQNLVERARGWTESDLRKHPTATLELIDELAAALKSQVSVTGSQGGK